MQINVNISDIAVSSMSEIPAQLRERLTTVLHRLSREIAADARTIAAAHIRFAGKHPGRYVASIYSGVKSEPQKISGWVRSSDPLSRLMEGGASRPAHDEMATVGGVLSWLDDAGQAFARHVTIPANVMKPYPAIKPAFESARMAATDAIRAAVRGDA